MVDFHSRADCNSGMKLTVASAVHDGSSAKPKCLRTVGGHIVVPIRYGASNTTAPAAR